MKNNESERNESRLKTLFDQRVQRIYNETLKMSDNNIKSIEAPIFILGITPRSGTNFLYELLLLHPLCRPGLANEDFLTAHSDLLMKYVKSVCKEWKPNWKIKQQLNQLEQVVFQYLGEGLLSFLNLSVAPVVTENDERLDQSSQKRLVSKTPTVKNLSNFFTLFPQAYLIILVRDGRAVVDSGIRSFGWSFEVMTHVWAEAAKMILEFERNNPNQRYLIVRYEDLYQETEKQLKRIFSFVGLDPNCYDYKKAAHLPIRGSSELAKEGKVHWVPVEKPPDFNPVNRWNEWGQAKLGRFNWLAGDYLVHFGYSQPDQLRVSYFWRVWNFVLDVKWLIRILLTRAQRFLAKLAGQD